MKDSGYFKEFYKNYQKAELFSWTLSACVFLLSFLTLIAGCVFDKFSFALLGVVIFWAYNFAYGIADLWERFNFFIMNFLLFVFIISRPVIGEIYNQMWWCWSDTTVKKVLLIVLLGEAALFVGSKLIYDLPPIKSIKNDTKAPSQNTDALRSALFILLIFSSLPAAYSQLATFRALRHFNYELMFTDYAPSMPFIIRVFNSIFPFAVFGYLATMPNKKMTVFALVLYVGMGVPIFLLGNRSSIIVKIAFATTYFLIRNSMEKDKKWVTTRIKIFFTVFVLFSVVLLGAMNYTRADKKVSDEAKMPIAIDFFYRQGTTFNTVCEGVEHERIISSLPPATSYTFGDIIDLFKYNRIGRFFFGTTKLPSGNSVRTVEESNSLSHRLSYVVFGEGFYLAGNGRGSSYLLETYLDGGFVFLMIFNLLFGAFLALAVRLVKRGNFFLNFAVISSLSEIFFLPRAQSTSFLKFILSMPFWFVIVYVFAATWFAKLKSKDEGSNGASSLGIRTSLK